MRSPAVMLRALVAFGGSFGVAGVCQAQFATGDVYLLSSGLPDPDTGACTGPGLLRINPTTWETSIVAHFSTNMTSRGAYDAARGRVVITYIDSTVELVDSHGVRTPMTYIDYNTALLAAPTGDGRIYLWGSSITPVHYYDAAGHAQTLMDTSGSAPFVLPGIIRAMTYDAGTSSLIVAGVTLDDMTQITRIPLSASGARVQAAPTSVMFDGSPGSAGENPVGFSRGPNGRLFLKIDDNSNALAGRMRLIDPVTLGVEAFAFSQYPGVGGETAGAYVPAAGGAVILDSFADVLRLYHQGDIGGGMGLPAMHVSCPGSGETAQMIVIDAGACRADFNGDGTVNSQDFFDFLGDFFASNARADFNGDHVINSQDFFDFLGAFFSGC